MRFLSAILVVCGATLSASAEPRRFVVVNKCPPAPQFTVVNLVPAPVQFVPEPVAVPVQFAPQPYALPAYQPTYAAPFYGSTCVGGQCGVPQQSYARPGLFRR